MKLPRIISIFLIAVGAALCAAAVTGCGETEQREASKTAELSFHSFDGGGPEYTVRIDDPTVVSCSSERRYNKADHKALDGAGYDVVFTLTGLRQGKTTLTVSARSPIADSFDNIYTVTVADDLSVSVEKTAEKSPDATEAARPVPQFMAAVGDDVFLVDCEDNAAVGEMIELLSRKAITVDLAKSGDTLSAGELPWNLPFEKAGISARAGDLLLIGENRLALCIGDGDIEGVKLGGIQSISDEQLAAAKAVDLWVEWSE